MRPARKKVQHAHDDMLERPESEQHTDDVGQDDAAHRIAAGDREKRQQGDQCAADDPTHKGGPAPAAGKVFRMCLSTPGAPVGNVPSIEITRIKLPSTTLTMIVHKQRRADLSRQKKSDGIPLPSHVAGSGILEQLVETARGYAKQAASENTLKAYGKDWAHFARWCRLKGTDPPPPSPEMIGLYLANFCPLSLYHRASSLWP